MKKAVREKAWKDFADWCEARGLRALPAHPWTVAYYIRWCEQRHRHPTILKRIKAISRVHLLKCHKPPDRHPVVLRTLRILEQRPRAKQQRAALFRAEDFVDNKEEKTPRTPDKKKRGAKGLGPDGHRGLGKRVLRSTPKLVSRRPATPD